MIYFDNAATTLLCDSAKEILLQDYGNPSSPHAFGLASERAIKKAAKKLATPLLCEPSEIIFTSGGTESNNLGILGTAFSLKAGQNKNRSVHILATNQEHPSVIEPLEYLKTLPGYSVTYAAPSEWEAYIRENTSMVCITQVSSDTGDMFNISKIYEELISKKLPNAIVFVDGAQGFCKAKTPNCADIYTFSGHKIHGPMGVGGLIVKKGLRLVPMMYGGGQQRQIRPGTENVSGILAMADSAVKHYNMIQQNHESVKKIKDILTTLVDEIPDTYINQTTECASSYILNMSFANVKGETLANMLSELGLYVSIGTACRTTKKESPLALMGFSRERANSAVRLSFSAMNTEKEALEAKEIIINCVKNIRKMRKI